MDNLTHKQKWERDKANQHRLLGLCLRCERPTAPGSVYCQQHRAYMNAANRKAYDARKAMHVCPRCKTSVSSRRVYCAACRSKHSLAMASKVIVGLLLCTLAFAQAPPRPTAPTGLVIQKPCLDVCTVVLCYTLPSIKKELTWTNPADTMYWSNEWNQMFSLLGPAPGQEWLPSAYVDSTYCYYLRAGGGRAPYAFSASTLPQGLVLNSSTGCITGVVRSPSISFITFTVTDMLGATVTISRNLETCYPEGPCGLFGTAPPTNVLNRSRNQTRQGRTQ
jgi:hypothetical protein